MLLFRKRELEEELAKLKEESEACKRDMETQILVLRVKCLLLYHMMCLFD